MAHCHAAPAGFALAAPASRRHLCHASRSSCTRPAVRHPSFDTQRCRHCGAAAAESYERTTQELFPEPGPTMDFPAADALPQPAEEAQLARAPQFPGELTSLLPPASTDAATCYCWHASAQQRRPPPVLSFMRLHRHRSHMRSVSSETAEVWTQTVKMYCRLGRAGPPGQEPISGPADGRRGAGVCDDPCGAPLDFPCSL